MAPADAQAEKPLQVEQVSFWVVRQPIGLRPQGVLHLRGDRSLGGPAWPGSLDQAAPLLLCRVTCNYVSSRFRDDLMDHSLPQAAWNRSQGLGTPAMVEREDTDKA